MSALVAAWAAQVCRNEFAALRVARRTELRRAARAAAPAPPQIRAIRAFGSVGRPAAWIARQVDVSEEVVKSVLKGDLK